MRIYEGDFAYEIERIIDPNTQLITGWRYKLDRVRPDDQLLESGEARTKEEAEDSGKRALQKIIRAA